MSYDRAGNHYRVVGDGEPVLGRQAYEAAAEIRERLMQAHHDRVDYQNALAVSYTKMRDREVHSEATLNLRRAREAYRKALAVRERLVHAEPDRADYQHHLAI